MKRSVLANRKDVVSAVIAAYPGGRHYAAADLGMPIKKFDSKAYGNAGSRPLSDEHIGELAYVRFANCCEVARLVLPSGRASQPQSGTGRSFL